MSERLYGDLSHWWNVLVPRESYRQEARDLLAVGQSVLGRRVNSWLELGSATGALASHLPQSVDVCLVDRSPQMLRISRDRNPSAAHVEGDIRTVRLEERYDLVLLHDTVMYLTTEEELRAAMKTMAAHVRADGCCIVVPDVVAETFQEGHVAGGGESPDGRSARLLEWHWQPDPGGSTYRAEMSLLLREPHGPVRAVHETHTLGLHSRRSIVRAMEQARLSVERAPRRFRNTWPELFVARPRTKRS